MTESNERYEAPCPTCERMCARDTSNPLRPFCSDRCKMADLAKWLEGDYVISRPMTMDEALEDYPEEH